MDRIYLALAALVGGLLVGLAGFLDAHEPWDSRKFGATVIRALFAGVIFAVGYQLDHPVAILDLLWAFLSGGGFDVGVNRVAGALGNGAFPLPSSKPK